jgi:hypothetical protein
MAAQKRARMKKADGVYRIGIGNWKRKKPRAGTPARGFGGFVFYSFLL